MSKKSPEFLTKYLAGVELSGTEFKAFKSYLLASLAYADIPKEEAIAIEGCIRDSMTRHDLEVAIDCLLEWGVDPL